MDFFVTDPKGVYILNHDGPIRVDHHENSLYILNNYHKSEYTQSLIDITLVSSGNESEVEHRLEELTKLKRFDFLLVKNYPETSRINSMGSLGSQDHYTRASRIALAYVKDSKVDHPDTFRSFTIADDDTRKVLARLPKITPEVMDALVTAGVIRSWEYYEYPWVNNFTFTQPKGSPAPADLRTHA